MRGGFAQGRKPRRSGMILGSSAGRNLASPLPPRRWSSPRFSGSRSRADVPGGIVRAEWREAHRTFAFSRRGAATSPPSLRSPLGVSGDTSTTRAGCDAGTKPTNRAMVDHRIAAGSVDLLGGARLARRLRPHTWPPPRSEMTTSRNSPADRSAVSGSRTFRSAGWYFQLAQGSSTRFTMGPHPVAAVRGDGRRTRHLDGGNPDFLAEGHRGQRRGAHAFGFLRRPPWLRRKTEARLGPEAEGLHRRRTSPSPDAGPHGRRRCRSTWRSHPGK